MKSVHRKLAARLTRSIRARLTPQRLARYRGLAFRQFHQLKGLPALQCGLNVSIPGQRLLLNCRLLDPKNLVDSIKLRYQDGSGQCITEDVIQYRTSPTSLSKWLLSPDQIDRFCGLINCTHSASDLNSIELHDASGKKIKSLRIRPEPEPSDIISVIARVLELVPKDPNEKRRVFDHSLGKTIGALWQTRNIGQVANNERTPDRGLSASVKQLSRYNTEYGEKGAVEPASPDISIVIPIYGRYDFIEYQLALFANDPFMYQQEILYVIDDPRLHEAILTSCDALSRIYKIPFTVMLLDSNHGYAAANNIGVEHAAGNHILLLNSDVFPQESGWLQAMFTNPHLNLSNSLLGARLKYHDESTQHNGMSFFKSPFAGDLWINLHPGKGLAIDQLPHASRPQPRESVTGACLLLSKENYRRLGGLDESYIQGDFEDSDLCMKAREHGLQILLDEHVLLYHLERQSQSMVSSKRWKSELTYYNCWYHSEKWHQQICRLKQEQQYGMQY